MTQTQTPPTQDDVDAMTAQLAAGLAMLNTALAPIREAVEGYRVQCERDGYPDALARSMAVDYHSALMRTVVR